jgi:hypothetical protein
MTASSSSGATVPIAQLVDGSQVDDVLADQLLGALRQLEDLHARGHAAFRPAECLRGTVLGEASIEHRVDGLGLLVGVQLLRVIYADRVFMPTSR